MGLFMPLTLCQDLQDLVEGITGLTGKKLVPLKKLGTLRSMVLLKNQEKQDKEPPIMGHESPWRAAPRPIPSKELR